MTQASNANPEITFIPIDKDLLALLYRIIEQNEKILKLNERILEVLEPPKFLYSKPDIEKIAKDYLK